MNVWDVLRVFARLRTNEPVMVSPGNSGTVLFELGHKEPTIYGASMGYAGPECFGLALARPDLKVVAVEGDGSLIAGLGFLTTLARYPLKNLVVLVMDNSTYLSTDRGELTSATASVSDLAGIARGAGVEKVATVETKEQADEWIGRALREDGPFVIVARLDRSGRLVRPTSGPLPDRTESSMILRRWLLEHRSDGGEASVASRLGSGIYPQQGGQAEDGPGRASARVLYQAMKTAGVNLFVYLPDSVTYPVQELAERDPEMATLCCAREDEGVAIAMGAYYGGFTAAMVMEGSGVGYSGLILSRCVLNRTPVFIMASHSESLGVRFDHDTTSRLVNEAVLRALHIPFTVLRRVEDAPLVIREAIHSMLITKLPQAVVIPPYIMGERGLPPLASSTSSSR